MRVMKDSGIDWIGSIPLSWDVTRGKAVFRLRTEKGNLKAVLLAATQKNGMYPQHLLEGVVQVAEGTDLQQFKTVHTDDYVISLRSFQGGIEMSDYEGVCSPAYQVFYNIKPIDKRYFKRLFKSQGFIDKMNSMTVGIREGKNILYSDFANSCIPYPPLSEQKSIADFLDRKYADIENVIEKTKASIDEYKRLKQSIITKAVTMGIRGIRPTKDSGIEWIGSYPEDWTLTKVKWLLNERNERSEDGSEEPLSMSQKHGLIPTKEMDTVPNMASSYVGAKVTYIGDLVFNKLKAHLGVFAVSKYEGLVSPDYAVYYKTERANMRYLEYLFKTPKYIHEFKKRSSGVGAGLTRLYTSDLFSMYAASPSLQEQQEIASYLDKKCSEIDSLISSKERFVKELESYKKSLVYEYVTGKRTTTESQV